MAIETEQPSEVTQIPSAPGIKLENLIQFDGNCIDPVALIIITESLDYALETSMRRLKSAGKIFSGIEESAYGGGKGILPVIKAVRDALLEAPQCTPGKSQPPPVSPPPREAIAAKAQRRTEEQAKTPTVEEVEKLQEAVSGAQTTEELLEAVKGYPELEKAIKATAPKTKKAKAKVQPEEESPKKEREQPELWGQAVFKGEGKEAELSGKYDSPGTLAKALGVKTRGAKDMKVAFERAGFEVRGDGEEVEKGKTGFVVQRVGPTPRKYRLVKEAPEFTGPGRFVLGKG